jgi:hypothetical protein
MYAYIAWDIRAADGLYVISFLALGNAIKVMGLSRGPLFMPRQLSTLSISG